MTAKRPKVERVRADAETFRQAIKIMGWTQQQAAEELGVHSRQRISEWMCGVRPVPYTITRSIAFRVDQALKRKGI